MIPIATFLFAIKSVSKTPTSFPENSLKSSPCFTAIPTLSQSGSVAIRISAPTSLATLRPTSSASLISGFGYGQVGKSPFGVACSFTISIFVKPFFLRQVVTHLKPVP